jgi:hypothetical protein
MGNWEEYETKRSLHVAKNASEHLPWGSEDSKKKNHILDSLPSDENSKLGPSDYDPGVQKHYIAITF